MNDALSVADRFFRAVETGDLDAVQAIYAPDAGIWHNTDNLVQTPAENLRTLKWITRTLRDRRYEVSRRVATPTGFAQEHVMRATLPDGTPFAMPAAIFADVVDGRITTLREYLDMASAAPLTALSAAS